MLGERSNNTMRGILFIVGLLVILYGILLVSASAIRAPPLTIVVPVPWSNKPATIDNPQIEPGVALILLGALISFAAARAG